jgi:hypothetical protein
MDSTNGTTIIILIFDREDCEAKAPHQIIFHFIIREFTKLQRSGGSQNTKVRRDDPKTRLRLPEAIYNPNKYKGKPLGQGGDPS